MPLKISVVIPTYKRPQLLRNCLAALQHQTLGAEAFEVLVVSDGYDASTETEVGTFEQQGYLFRYLHLPQKKGPAAARNLGWKQARASLIAFTDDDTIPDAGWLQAFWKAYNHERLIAFTGRVQVPLSKTPTDYERNTAGLERAEFVTANCCCTIGALQKVGGFDERFSMAWREDSDLQFNLLKQGIPIQNIPEALVVHPVRQARWGISIREQKKGLFNALLYKKFPQLYRRNIQPHPAWNYYLIVLLAGCLVVAVVYKSKGLGLLALAGWMLLTGSFVKKRLATTSRSKTHVLEMIITSVVIPFTSVYWQLSTLR